MTAEVLLRTVRPHIDAGRVPGAVVGVVHDGATTLSAAGTTTPAGTTPLTVDTPVRISSMTKPIVAFLALALVEDGLLALDDPITRLVPELAGQRVLRRLTDPVPAATALGATAPDATAPDGPHRDDPAPRTTVPAERLATVEDLLTMRSGFGAVPEGPCPTYDRAGDAGLGTGPPDPSVPLSPDRWVRAFATLPLLDQPGTTWRYDLSYGLLGVLLARAAGAPLDEVLRTRVLAPLGMHATGFVAPPGALPPCFVRDGDVLTVFDGSHDSRWSRQPSFPDARGGLVSTAADLLRFAAALLRGGDGVVSRTAVAAMTTDHLGDEQRRAPSAAPFLDGSGWGYGVQVSEPGDGSGVRAPRYGWAGGLGTLWYSWPDQDAAAVLLTQVMPPSAEVFTPFVAAAETLLVPG